MVPREGHAPLCWIWVHPFFEIFRDLTGSLPKGKQRGYFSPNLASPLYLPYLPGCPPQLFPSAVAAAVPATPVTAEMALALQVLYFDCSSPEMSMASQSLKAKKMFEKLKEINLTRLGENIFG